MNKEYQMKVLEKIIELHNNGRVKIKIEEIDKRYTQKGQSDVYETLNKILYDLETKGFIQIEQLTKGQIVTSKTIKIFKIQKEKMNELASQCGLKTREQLNEESKEILLMYQNSHCLLQDFIHSSLDDINKNNYVSLISISKDVSILENTLKAIDMITKQKDDILLRDMSQKIFSNSKDLEEILPSIGIALKNAYDNIDDFLREFHVFKNPTGALIKGCGVIYFKHGDRITLRPNAAIELDKEYVNDIDRIEVETVLTVENKTSFYKIFNNPFNGAILFLGGYSNNVNIDLIKKTNAQIRHFGDLDANGFKIARNLERRVGRTVDLYQMDLEILKKYQHYAKTMTDFNRKSLKLMLEDNYYSKEQKELFQYMLDNNVTLEQEIIDAI